MRGYGTLGRAVAVVGMLTMTGCAVPKVSLADGPREYVATDYENVLRKWTRTEQLVGVSELESFLTVTATFESWDFRWAYVVRYVEDYRLTIEQRKKLLEQAGEDAKTHYQFFVTLYGGSRRHNDLSRADSAWIVRLIDDRGNETAPDEITAVERPNAVERTYYPFNPAWRRAFRIRFPRELEGGRPTVAPDARRVGLRFAGAQGNVDLVWRLEPNLPEQQ